jgi:hypothetical protein
MKMTCRVWLLNLILSIAVLACGAAAQAAMTGTEFLQAPRSYQDGFVSGFVRGMYMTCLDHLENKKQICSFDSVLDVTFEMTPEQVLDIFVSYLKKNPEVQQKEISELLTDCLKEAAGNRPQLK